MSERRDEASPWTTTETWTWTTEADLKSRIENERKRIDELAARVARLENQCRDLDVWASAHDQREAPISQPKQTKPLLQRVCEELGFGDVPTEQEGWDRIVEGFSVNSCQWRDALLWRMIEKLASWQSPIRLHKWQQGSIDESPAWLAEIKGEFGLYSGHGDSAAEAVLDVAAQRLGVGTVAKALGIEGE